MIRYATMALNARFIIISVDGQTVTEFTILQMILSERHRYAIMKYPPPCVSSAVPNMNLRGIYLTDKYIYYATELTAPIYCVGVVLTKKRQAGFY